jgi:hypothetical protein
VAQAVLLVPRELREVAVLLVLVVQPMRVK